MARRHQRVLVPRQRQPRHLDQRPERHKARAQDSEEELDSRPGGEVDERVGDIVDFDMVEENKTQYGRNESQDTEGKDAREAQLLPKGHAETPDDEVGHDEEEEIGDDVEGGVEDVESDAVDGVGRGDGVIPVGFDGGVGEDVGEEGADHVADVGGDKAVAEKQEPAAGFEDAAVEEDERDAGQRVAGCVEQVEGVIVQVEFELCFWGEREVMLAEAVVVAFDNEHDHRGAGEEGRGQEGPVVS